MRLRFFGDSYDIVKKSLLAWLSSLGEWETHPMFTEEVSPGNADAFAAFLGTPLLSREVLTSRTNRARYFATCHTASHLFLDPDTGVSLERATRVSAAHLTANELLSIVSARPRHLTLVFDQSFARGARESVLARKFAFFRAAGVDVAAYWSHAPFLLLGLDRTLVDRALTDLLAVSGLPSSRFRRALSRDGQDG